MTRLKNFVQALFGKQEKEPVRTPSASGITYPKRIRADFNGLFSEVLCLSHEDTCVDEDGQGVVLQEGMKLTAFDEDVDEHGNRDDLIASGTVERSPQWLRCTGSRWVLRFDENGVQHESDFRTTQK